jgi:hypothetical protein
MLRKAVLALSLTGTCAMSFALVSYADSSSAPTLPSSLPISAGSAVALSNQGEVALNNTIGSDLLGRYGISPGSYANARSLAAPGGATDYVVPGTGGVCIVSATAAACGDPDSSGDPLALYSDGSAGGTVTGAGIAASSATSVTISDAGGAVRLPVTGGVFVLPAGAGIGSGDLTTTSNS